MNSTGNVFTFNGNNMIVRAKGPNMDKNISSSFRSNLLSSTMNLPRNFERQGYTLSSQRSMIYGRELSPTASVRSDFQPRNFYQPFNRGYSQMSAYNGRGGSPVSMRSMDSTASVATDIAQGIKNGNFNEYEWRLILQAVNNKRKHNFRRRAEKRRKTKSYFCNIRNRSEDDSGEQGSGSSMSSDDCMSTRTGYSRRLDRNYKENVPQSLPSLDSRSIDTNFRNDIRDTRQFAGYVKENSLRRDPANSELIMQSKPNNIFNSQMNHINTFSSRGNILSAPRNVASSQSNINIQENQPSSERNTLNLNTSVYSTKSLQNSTVTFQKDRFKSVFQLSSQRINKSLKPIEELKKNENVKSLNKNINNNNNKRNQTSVMEDNSSEDDTIFLDTTKRPKTVSKNNNARQKRNVECLDDVPVSAKKKCKTTTLNNNKAGRKTQNIVGNNDFVFAKPQFPARKKPIEKLISKSAVPFSDIAFNVREGNTHEQAVDAPIQEKEAEPAETSQLTNSDVSMRPSFIKRKLFTQTLDITERKNNSSESISIDSPQNNIYSALLQEKHKTRKLTSSQSLLSRDVNQDDNNLLDLIHKIVPPSQVNTTNIAKQLRSNKRPNKNKTANDGDDKWDITSILSTCNNDSVSDTYTDDEIFKVNDGNKTSKTNKCQEKVNSKQGKAISDKKKTNDISEINKGTMTKCNVVVQKLTMLPPAPIQMKSPVRSGPAKKATLSNSRIDAFWDSESDYECPATPRRWTEKQLHGTSNNNSNTPTPKQSSIKRFLEVGPKSSANKISMNTKTQISSLVVNKNDTTLVKALKKQTNEQTTIKTSTTTQITKNTKNKEAQPEQTDKIKKAPAAKTVRMRKQTKHLSAVDESYSSKDDLPIRTNCSEINSKQSNMTKTKEKITKTHILSESTKKRNKSLNNSRSQIDNTKKPKPQKKANHQTRAKTKLQDDIEDIQNSTISKVLRSRIIDLSSSFNSDKFELTGLSLARKSRTPSKRISFNKSRNIIINKGRNKK